MSQAAPKPKPVVGKQKVSTVKKKKLFLKRPHAPLGLDETEGPKPLSTVVIVIVGLGFIAGGSAMIAYGKTNDLSQDFIIIGGCMIVFGCLFLGMAFVFVVRPLYKRRRVQSAIEEKSRQEAALGVDEYIGSGELTVNFGDVARQRRPSAVELYYEDGGKDTPVRSTSQTSQRPPPPMVALPGDRQNMVPVFQAPLPQDKI